MRTTSSRRFVSMATALLLFAGALSLPLACEPTKSSNTDIPSPSPTAQDAAVAANVGASQQAGFYRARVGDISVTALSDGTVGLDVVNGLLLDAKPGEVEQLLAQAFQTSPIDASFNAFLITLDASTLLIDTGAAANMGPTAGKLDRSLAHAGVRAEDVTDVFLTHVHPDHSGGLVVDGKMAFPQATLHLDQRDLDYWMDPVLAAKATGMQATFFAAARVSLQPYVDAKRVKAFAGATEFFPGFSASPAYGHTPGHTMYQLDRQGQKLRFVGDLIHVAAVQFDDPGVAVAFDVDPAAAVDNRKRVLAEAADEGYLVAHNHASFPGMGHVRREAGTYRWVPISYVNDSILK